MTRGSAVFERRRACVIPSKREIARDITATICCGSMACQSQELNTTLYCDVMLSRADATTLSKQPIKCAQALCEGTANPLSRDRSGCLASAANVPKRFPKCITWPMATIQDHGQVELPIAQKIICRRCSGAGEVYYARTGAEVMYCTSRSRQKTKHAVMSVFNRLARKSSSGFLSPVGIADAGRPRWGAGTERRLITL
jgi:hypothetical protein